MESVHGRNDAMTKAKDGKQVNKRLYKCEECYERRFIAWVELNRASKPRCMKCGSTRLELVSDEAKDDRARLNQERLAGTVGSLKLATSADHPNRKVV